MIVLALLVILFAVASWCFQLGRSSQINKTHIGNNNKLTVVIAHPDDEAMFMTPAIEGFMKLGKEISILCFSNGNADGLGKIREKELIESGSVLGIPVNRIKIIDDDRLQDGMQRKWSQDLIKTIIKNDQFTKNSDILTFDGYGVSGHPNHIDLSNAIRSCTPRDQIVYQVVSVSILVKYLWIYSRLYTPFNSHITFHSTSMNPFRCMMKHQSQLVWFRWLSVLFSRYSYSVDVEVLR